MQLSGWMKIPQDLRTSLYYVTLQIFSGIRGGKHIHTPRAASSLSPESDYPAYFVCNIIRQFMQEFLRGDRLALHWATARFLYASRCLDRLVGRAPVGRLTMPVTLILSADDRIIDSDATARSVTRLTAGRAEIVSLSGAHTLEFAEDPSAFHQALLAACQR